MSVGVNDVRQLGTILGIWAHPDDETFSMAGIMAAAVENGQKVVCISATRGEAGVQDENRWPAKTLGQTRTKELQAAMKHLGVTTHYWLDYPDGGCCDCDKYEAVRQIAKIIKKYSPDSIFTFGPDGMTGHADHRIVSYWVSAAVVASGSNAKVYHAVQTIDQYKSMKELDKTFDIFFNIDVPPVFEERDCAVCFNLTPRLFNKKLLALQAMPSQTEGILRMFDHILTDSVGVEAFRLYQG